MDKKTNKRKKAGNATSPSTSTQLYCAEKIMNHRTRNGKIEYFIKWKGYSSKMNTWEPEHHLEPRLLAIIRQFGEKSLAENVENECPSKVPPVVLPLYDTYCYGFDRGLKAEKVLDITIDNGELKYLFKWKDSDEGELIPARIANVKFPQLVIQHYEEIFQWDITDNNSG